MPDITANDKLVFAATAWNFRTLRERAEAGADINHVHPERGTALYAAASNPQCVGWLLANGAEPNRYICREGCTALDRALELSGGAAASLLHRAGATGKRYRILPPPTSDQWLVGRLHVPGYLSSNRAITAGEVSFGPIDKGETGWIIRWDRKWPTDREFNLFRLEAISFDRYDIQRIHQKDAEFEAEDTKGRRHPLTTTNGDLYIDAIVSVF